MAACKDFAIEDAFKDVDLRSKDENSLNIRKYKIDQ